MGASQSTPDIPEQDKAILAKELQTLRDIVGKVINERNFFKNPEYNFLSEDVCQKYHVILESDLSKMLKLTVKSIGDSLLVIPKTEENALLEKRGLKKDEICSKVANHYIRILYVMCLIKYVYNLEQDGDLSLAGIFFRQIKKTANNMTVEYCKGDQKNILAGVPKDGSYDIDFSSLEGFQFFVEYFLDKQEANAFLKAFRHIIANTAPKGVLQHDLCALRKGVIYKEFIDELNDMFQRRFGEPLICKGQVGGGAPGSQSLSMVVGPENPMFHGRFCTSKGVIQVPLNESDGKEALSLYKDMKTRYAKNVKKVEKLMDALLDKKEDGVSLKDITKVELDEIINQVKMVVSIFYLQSIWDAQNFIQRVKGMKAAVHLDV